MSDKASRHVTVTRIPVAGEGRKGAQRMIEIRVVFDYGGVSYATYKEIARGYYLSLNPVEVGNGFASYTLGAGNGAFLQPADRYNGKQMAHWCAAVGRNDFMPLPQVVECLQSLCKRHGLVITDEAWAAVISQQAAEVAVPA